MGSSRATFETYTREDGRYDWRLTHRNGNIVATSGGQGYENEQVAWDIGWKVVTGGYDVSAIES